ncbi:MAG TPA: hypothetical protein VFU48_09420 [Nitrospira sp.]|nr:hypothetical protein [Nitrospira sp.]
MFMFIQSQDRHEFHPGGPKHPVWSWIGISCVLGALWLILELVGCSASRKEYVVDYARGNDRTAQGSRERPCQTEVQCRMLAERDGVHSYWMLYQ